MTGFLVYSSNTERFDAYCYDESDTSDKNCNKSFHNVPDTKEQKTTPTSQSDGVIPTQIVEIDENKATTAVTPNDLSKDDFTKVPEEENPLGGSNDTIVVSAFTTLEPESTDGSGMDTPTTKGAEATGVIHIETATSSEKKPAENAEPTVAKPNERGRKLSGGEAENDKRSSSSSDWLVVIGVIVAVGAILFVCAVVARRKGLCGRKQTLHITAKENSDGNGVAAAAGSSHNPEREQEMVTLMNKEPIQENGNTEEFTVIKLEESPDKDQQA